MIEWGKFNQGVDSATEEEAFAKIGVGVKKRYVDLCIEGESVAAEGFDALVSESVNQASGESADVLNQTYLSGQMPRMDDTIKLARYFLRSLSRRFQNAICAELWEARALSSSSRDLVIALVPTVIVVLSLSPAYAALAIPISVILVRSGLKEYCKGYEQQELSRQLVEARLHIHRTALVFLHAERARQVNSLVPEPLSDAIKREEQRISDLERKLLGLPAEPSKADKRLPPPDHAKD